MEQKDKQHPFSNRDKNLSVPFFIGSPDDLSRSVMDDTIIFSKVQQGSSAVYQCNVSNAYGYLLSNAFVNVLCESHPPGCTSCQSDVVFLAIILHGSIL